VFRAVFARVGGFRRDQPGHTFRGWLRRITQNKLNDHHRRSSQEVRGTGGSSARDRLQQQPAPEPADDSTAHDDDGESALFARALNLIRAEFAEQTWLAFWRTAIDGRPAKDVAAELGTTAGAVRVARCRVVRRLREELGEFL
jgi:RNA polymerase sigma-70 factor (ECF subfamily)